MTRDEAIDRLVEMDVARWGEQGREAAREHNQRWYPTRGLAINGLAARLELTDDPEAPELRRLADAALTAELDIQEAPMSTFNERKHRRDLSVRDIDAVVDELAVMKRELTTMLARVDKLLRASGVVQRKLILEGYAAKDKIAVIKAVRELTGLGLAEVKRLVERPFPVTLVSEFVEPSDDTTGAWALSYLQKVARVRVVEIGDAL